MSQAFQPQKKISFLDFVWHFKVQLAIYILVISCVSFAVLYIFGGVPDELKVLDTTEENVATQASVEETPHEYVQLRTRTTMDENIPLPKFTTTKPATSNQAVSKPTQTTPSSNTQNTATAKGTIPTSIVISKIGVNVTVLNPSSSHTDVLNQNLLKGAVRYPGSGTLEEGNMFIMGHSSYLKVVNNKAYKAFNRLENLSKGDTIVVKGAGKEAVYSVTSVSLVDSDEGYVNLKTNQHMLTLVTCNVLGEKQERFLVEATFVRYN